MNEQAKLYRAPPTFVNSILSEGLSKYFIMISTYPEACSKKLTSMSAGKPPKLRLDFLTFNK